MTITLQPPSADEAQALAREIERGYAVDMQVNAGFSPDDARRKAAADVPALLAEETSALYTLHADGKRVGHLWVGERDGDRGRLLFIYDIHVDDAFRGRGYGREAMLLAEGEVRQRGLERIGLNVFGGNEVARGLYRSLGYKEIAVVMHKDVS